MQHSGQPLPFQGKRASAPSSRNNREPVTARGLRHCHRYRRHIHRSCRLRCRDRRSRLHQESDDLRSTGRRHLRLHPQGRDRRARCELRQARHHAGHQRAVAAGRRQDRAAGDRGLPRPAGNRPRQPDPAVQPALPSGATAGAARAALRGDRAGGRLRKVRTPIALDELAPVADILRAQQVEALAISFLNSYLTARA